MAERKKGDRARRSISPHDCSAAYRNTRAACNRAQDERKAADMRRALEVARELIDRRA